MQCIVLALWLLLAQSTTISGSGSTVFSGSGTSEVVDRWLMLFGDSKTAYGSLVAWHIPLARQGATSTSRVWEFNNAGVGGTTVATTLSALTATLAKMPGASGAADIRVLINLGVNDISGGLPVEATWNADYGSILDAIHAKWPTATIYVTRPWLQGFETDCNTVASRITTIVAAHSAFTVVGDDERVWLKGGDDGATMTTDGTHYSAAGNAEKVVQMTAVLWP